VVGDMISSGEPDRNRVYKLSNTTAENLRMACSVSTVGCSHSERSNFEVHGDIRTTSIDIGREDFVFFLGIVEKNISRD
jgi:hypothetical protein